MAYCKDRLQQQCSIDYLPEEILETIFKSLTDVSELYKCRRVCSLWHRVATHVINTLPNLFRISVAKDDDDTRQKHNRRSQLSTYNPPTVTIPDNCLTETNYSLTAHRGWFFLTDKKNTDNVFLYHPISRKTIKLPQMPNRICTYRVSFATSSAPTDPNCIVLACYNSGGRYRFVFCTPGDRNWKSVLVSDEEIINQGICDMIHYKAGGGTFYCVDRGGLLHCFNLGVEVPCIEARTSNDNVWYFNIKKRYLVESPSKELVMVDRVVLDSGQTIRIQVFKMNWESSKWELTFRKFGNRESIFLAHCDSKFVSTDHYRANCIYFTDDNRSDDDAFCQDFGFYNKVNRRMRYLRITSSSFEQLNTPPFFQILRKHLRITSSENLDSGHESSSEHLNSVRPFYRWMWFKE